MSTEVDLTSLPEQQAKEALGTLLKMCLMTRGAAVFLVRPDGKVAVVDPQVLSSLSPEQLVPYLLTWPEDQIEEFLEARDDSARK